MLLENVLVSAAVSKDLKMEEEGTEEEEKEEESKDGTEILFFCFICSSSFSYSSFELY